jgi:hypothetical protein
LKKFLVAALLASAIAVPASAAQLVVNGGFEDPAGLIAGWTYSVSSTLSVFNNASAAHSGDNWLRFTADGEYASDFIYQTLDTVVGQTYAYSYWVAATTTDDQAPSRFYATIGSDVMTDSSNTGTFDYVQVSGNYVATSSSTEIYFQAFNSLGLYLLDDVSVTGPSAVTCDTRVCVGGGGGEGGGVPEPASWALMVLGFGGLGAALRRRPRIQAA